MLIVKSPCYVFDIDGTVADLSHRLHHISTAPKNWDAFFDDCWKDTPIQHMRQVARDLLAAGRAIVFVSGRSDRVRDKTEAWLRAAIGNFGALYMRADGDRRPDHIVKSELLDRLLADGFAPIMVFDDRASVVAMWRARGIACAQVAEGNF